MVPSILCSGLSHHSLLKVLCFCSVALNRSSGSLINYCCYEESQRQVNQRLLLVSTKTASACQALRADCRLLERSTVLPIIVLWERGPGRITNPSVHWIRRSFIGCIPWKPTGDLLEYLVIYRLRQRESYHFD